MSIEEEEDASLKELVTKTLQSNGVLGKIQAQLRASVFLALEDELKEKNIPLVSESVKKLLATSEGATAAALVHDFLQCLGLEFSLAVFAPESGHSTFWSFPGTEALTSNLSLNTDKGYKTPLLIELLKERQSSTTSPKENTSGNRGHHSQSHILSSIPSHSHLPDSNELYKIQPESALSNLPVNIGDPNISVLSTKTGERSSGLSKHDTHLPTEEEQRAREEGKNIDWPSVKGLEKHQDRQTASAGNSSTLGDIAAPKCPVMMPTEENNHVSSNTVTGEEKQYEDDFSSMSEKEGHDDGEEEEEDEVDEEDDDVEEGEDIDEDISLDDLINSSASVGSDQTKDQSLSQVSDIANYQEDL